MSTDERWLAALERQADILKAAIIGERAALAAGEGVLQARNLAKAERSVYSALMDAAPLDVCMRHSSAPRSG